MKNVRIIASLVPVKRLSVQQREHHTIDSTNLARILWTPAMQAGLVKKQLSFREIFMALEIIFCLSKHHINPYDLLSDCGGNHRYHYIADFRNVACLLFLYFDIKFI
jgi:hypothetical protein